MKTIYLGLHVMENRTADLLPSVTEKIHYFSWLLEGANYPLFLKGFHKNCAPMSPLCFFFRLCNHTKASVISDLGDSSHPCPKSCALSVLTQERITELGVLVT